MKNILIYGMGMMGTSLAHSIQKNLPIQKINAVVRTKKSANYIQNHKIANEVFIHESLNQIQELELSQYDLIVLGIPPKSIISLVPFIPESSALITDMSSTRRAVHDAFAKRPELRFIGSHPMCGSENKGPASSSQNLFENHLCFVIKETIDDKQNTRSQSKDIQIIQEFWKKIGMRTSLIKARDHDEVLAYLSHAPHMISSLLTHWATSSSIVKKTTESSPMPVTGGGFRSMARIAGSNPEMWNDILDTNKDNILIALKKYHEMMGDLIKKIDDGNENDMTQWHLESRKTRDTLCNFDSEVK